MFTKPGFWEDFVNFPQEKQQNTKFTKFFQFGPRKFTKSDFSGLAPIQRVLTCKSTYAPSLYIVETRSRERGPKVTCYRYRISPKSNASQAAARDCSPNHIHQRMLCGVDKSSGSRFPPPTSYFLNLKMKV